MCLTRNIVTQIPVEVCRLQGVSYLIAVRRDGVRDMR